MIEIIREEDYEQTKERVLPKDIKQIGKPDIGDRIYVEDRVYRYLHPYDDQLEKAAYVLLGRFENYAGRQCTFIEGAIRLEEMNFDGELPQWNDNTWGYIYKKLKKDYDDMVIVGWAMDIKGQLPNLTARIEKLHQNHFGGIHQVLFLMDTLEKEEAFYSSKNNHLYRRDGFYIYYGKGIPAIVDYQEEERTQPQEIREEGYSVFEMETPEKRQQDLDLQERIYFEQSDMLEKETEQRRNFGGEEPRKEGSYRKQLTRQETKEKAPAFTPSLVLLAVVCVLGFAAYQNHQKMNDMQNALAEMNATTVTTEEKDTETAKEVKIEQVEGNVEKQKDTETSAQPETTGANTDGETADAAGTGNEDNAQAADAAAGTDTAAGTTTGTDTAAGTATGTDTATGTTTGTNTAAGNTAGADTTVPSADETATTGKTDTGDNETANAATTGTNGASDTAAATTEAQTYLKQGYYIVQKGDSLAGICRKIYQTTAMMDEVCKANNIEDPNDIYAGQYLTLPN